MTIEPTPVEQAPSPFLYRIRDSDITISDASLGERKLPDALISHLVDLDDRSLSKLLISLIAGPSHPACDGTVSWITVSDDVLYGAVIARVLDRFLEENVVRDEENAW